MYIYTYIMPAKYTDYFWKDQQEMDKELLLGMETGA